MSQQQRAGNAKAEAANKTSEQAAPVAGNLVLSDEAMERIAKLEKEEAELRAELARVNSEAVLAETRKREAEAAAEEMAAAMAKLNARIENQVTREEEAVKRQLASQRKVRIIIPKGRGAHEVAPVALAVNGREFLIVRDEEVDVPESVTKVLDLAVETVFVPTGEGASRQYAPTKRPAFPYKMLGYVDEKSARDDA